MFSPVIQALTEATTAKLAQPRDQQSPLRSNVIASTHAPMSPVVAAQQPELRQFREFLSQLSPNAGLFSQLLEQELYEYRIDTDNQVAGFSLSPGPLRQGFVLMHLDKAKVQANLDLHHVRVGRDWVKQYFVVTGTIGGVPHVSPLQSRGRHSRPNQSSQPATSSLLSSPRGPWPSPSGSRYTRSLARTPAFTWQDQAIARFERQRAYAN